MDNKLIPAFTICNVMIFRSKCDFTERDLVSASLYSERPISTMILSSGAEETMLLILDSISASVITVTASDGA